MYLVHLLILISRQENTDKLMLTYSTVAVEMYEIIF